MPEQFTAVHPATGSIYAWTFDGPLGHEALTPTQSPQLTYTFRSPGDYRLSLSVTDAHGAAVTFARSIHVDYPPVVALRLPPKTSLNRAVTLSFASQVDPSAHALYYQTVVSQLGARRAAAAHAYAAAINALGRAGRPVLRVRGTEADFAILGANVSTTPHQSYRFSHAGQYLTVTKITASDGQTAINVAKFGAGAEGSQQMANGTPAGAITQFSVSTQDPTAEFPTSFVDLSTDPPGSLGPSKSGCAYYRPDNGQCLDPVTITPKQYHDTSWNYGGDYLCDNQVRGASGFPCPNQFQAKNPTVDYIKGGTYAVTMTITRHLSSGIAVDQVSLPITVRGAHCGPIMLAGIEIDPVGTDCVPVATDGAGNQQYMMGSGLILDGLGVKTTAANIIVTPALGTITTGPNMDPLTINGRLFDLGLPGATIANVPGIVIDPARNPSVPLQLPFAVDLSSTTLHGLRVLSGGTVTLNAGAAAAVVHLTAALPDPFSGPPIGADLPATNERLPSDTQGNYAYAKFFRAAHCLCAHKADAPNLMIGPIDANFGGLNLGSISFSHNPMGWDGSAYANFAPVPLKIHVALAEGGGFKGGDAAVDFGPGEFPIIPGLLDVTHLDFGVQTHPSAFGGHVTAETPGGSARVEGCLEFVFAGDADVGRTEPLCSNSQPVTRAEFATRAEGDAFVLGTRVGGGFFEYHAGGALTFGADVDLPLVGDLVRLQGKVGGVFDGADNWEVGGSASIKQKILCFPLLGCPGVGVKALVSSIGASACGELAGFGVGGWLKWAGDAGVIFGSCDNGLANVALGGQLPDFVRSFRVAHDAGEQIPLGGSTSVAIPLKAGHPYALIAVRGAGGPPRVTVTGPGGRVLTQTDQGIQPVGPQRNNGFLRSDPLATTFIYVRGAASGTWTIQTQPGSPTIVGLKQGYGLPPINIKATVSGRGPNRTLHFHEAVTPGEQVMFAEEGPGVLAHPIAGGARSASLVAAARTSGATTFHPSTGPGGLRQIVALVSNNGIPRGKVTVATFRAPTQTPLGAPSRLRVVRQSARAVVSWRGVAGASSYRLEVAQSDGRQYVLIVPGNQGHAELILPAPIGLRVRLIARRAGRYGPPSTSAVQAPRRRRLVLRI